MKLTIAELRMLINEMLIFEHENQQFKQGSIVAHRNAHTGKRHFAVVLSNKDGISRLAFLTTNPGFRVKARPMTPEEAVAIGWKSDGKQTYLAKAIAKTDDLMPDPRGRRLSDPWMLRDLIQEFGASQ